MLLVRTYIAPSDIEEVGVFAGEPIDRGKRIWCSDPTFDLLVPPSTYHAAPLHLRDLLDRYSYPSADTPGHLVFEADNGRFMNHSERPNTDFSNADIGVAIGDIAVGEEITCDYRQFMNEPDS